MAKDRRAELLTSSTLNGIDFVEVFTPEDQKTLRVHFLNDVDLNGTITGVTITGGDTIPTVRVNPIDDAHAWSTEDERLLLTLTVDRPGDFSKYTLTLISDSTSIPLDPYFAQATFSFKVHCPSDLDCAPGPPVCPPLTGEAPPIDYLAKDFLSFRQALSDFSALRYPGWQERSEADFGVMMMEALCSLADDLSYLQDRIAAEAALDTATQRRSLVHHARLVDYEPRPATSARVLLQVNVSSDISVPPGVAVSAQGPEGASLDFEIGEGLNNEQTHDLKAAWNPGIQPYWWDDSQRCLKAGATEMWIEGDGFGFQAGTLLLIDTEGINPADPPIREVVQLAQEAVETTDPLFPQVVTQLVWRAEDALRFDHDLTRTHLAGNLVPATQGRRYTEMFAINQAPTTAPQMALALVRTGPNSTATAPVYQYLYSLREPPLAWLQPSDPEVWPKPEIQLTQSGSTKPWRWRHRLLEADSFEQAYTIDPGRYRRIGRNVDGSEMADYDGDPGETLRFGDGAFGALPELGAVFEVTYRVGDGAAGNVAADTITRVDPTWASCIQVTNPFPATGGADEEPAERIRRLAPQAFRAQQFRAVTAEDYEAAAEALPWVQRAGATFRWTGSWLSVFTTPDPQGSTQMAVDQHRQLIDRLNRYRLAGYESYVLAPHYRSIDLTVTVCARPDAFRGDVAAALRETLSNRQTADGSQGFFHPDRFTFGQALERSALESAIQSSYGVAGVLSIQYRQRGVTQVEQPLPDRITIPADAVLRLDNDPNHPEWGALRIQVEGGK